MQLTKKTKRIDLTGAKTISFKVNNLAELEKLLRTAAKQTEQLQQTLDEIQRFQLSARSQVDE